MASIPGSVPVGGFIAPTDSTDTYASHDEMYGKGGYKVVATIQERDGIPAGRRKQGSPVYVSSTQKEYRLVGGITNSDWQELYPQETTKKSAAHGIGCMYNFLAATSAVGFVTGWRVPTVSDFDELMVTIGNTPENAWFKLATSKTYSSPQNDVLGDFVPGVNQYGFDWRNVVTRNGYYGTFEIAFDFETSYIWTSTSATTSDAFAMAITNEFELEPGQGGTVDRYQIHKNTGAYIRLVKDDITPWTEGMQLLIDGVYYDTVRIGTKVWMAQNLATFRYNDKSAIPYINTNAAWAAATTGAMCVLDNTMSSGGALSGKTCILNINAPKPVFGYNSFGIQSTLTNIDVWYLDTGILYTDINSDPLYIAHHTDYYPSCAKVFVISGSITNFVLEDGEQTELLKYTGTIYSGKNMVYPTNIIRSFTPGLFLRATNVVASNIRVLIEFTKFKQ